MRGPNWFGSRTVLVLASKSYLNNEMTINSLTLRQCILGGPVYTGMSPERHWLTQCTLEYHWPTQWTLAGYTGTPLEKLIWNYPTLECHWRNWLLQPKLEHHWRDCKCPHIWLSRVASMPVWNDKMAVHQAASRQVSVNPACTWSLLFCNAYQFCSSNVWVIQHCSVHALDMRTIIVFCVFGVAVQMESA